MKHNIKELVNKCDSCIKKDVCKFKDDYAKAVDEIKGCEFFNKNGVGIIGSLDCNYYYRAEPVSKAFDFGNTTDEITTVRAGW